MPRKITVATLPSDAANDNRTVGIKDALRALRPIGVRFSVTESDDDGMTIHAWIADATPRQPRASRRALGTSIPSHDAESIRQTADGV